MNDDISPEYRARIEAEYRLVMTPGELALVDEFDGLEHARSAGQFTSEQMQRQNVVASMQGRIWAAALYRKLASA